MSTFTARYPVAEHPIVLVYLDGTEKEAWAVYPRDLISVPGVDGEPHSFRIDSIRVYDDGRIYWVYREERAA